MSDEYFSRENKDGKLKSIDELIDLFTTETLVIDARLCDYITTLDDLRDQQKLDSLDRFGFSPIVPNNPNHIQELVLSHLRRFDLHIAGYLYYTHIILVFMILEDRLISFGKIMKLIGRAVEFDPDKYRIRSGSDTVLERFGRYLETSNIHVPESDAIETLRLLRNCLVHANGRVGGMKKLHDSERLRHLVGGLKGVNVDHDDRLEFSVEGCLHLQGTMRGYLLDLLDAADFHIAMPPDRTGRADEA